VKSKWLPTFPLHAANWLADPRVQMLKPVAKSQLLEALLRSWMLGKAIVVPAQIAEAYASLWPEYEAVLREHVESYERRVRQTEAARKARHSAVTTPVTELPQSPVTGSVTEGTPTPTPTVSPSEIHRAKNGRRGARLPDDSELTPEWREIAAKHGTADVERVFREFVNYWTSLPGAKATKLDWRKTWENRCIEVATRGVGRSGYQRPPTVDERNRSAAALVKAKYALPEVQQ
jgi:hypothetical protein